MSGRTVKTLRILRLQSGITKEMLFAASLALAPLCRGALLESQSWVLLGTASGKTGYDSNLTFSRDGSGDGFAAGEADLLLERLNSTILTQLAATLSETQFFSGEAASQLDASATATLRYPSEGDELPEFSGTAGWNRITAADPEVNRRLTLEKTYGDFGGRLLTSGKFGWDADIASGLYDYSSDGLGRSYQTTLSTGAAFDPSPLTEISLNAVGGLGASNGNNMQSVQDKSITGTLQLRGQVVPKLTSTLYVGVTHIEYSGGFTDTSTLPTSGGELVWSISPGKSLRGGVSISTGFAPDGATQRKSQEILDYRQSLSRAWSVDLSLIGAHYSDRTTDFLRKDSSVSAGITIIDAPSKRFDLSAGFSLLHQTSNTYEAGFARYLTTIQANWHL